ncbi:MAG: redoxin domain-containing protein [bacterium]|nr:redoxin domain-containing protein [bacterium]
MRYFCLFLVFVLATSARALEQNAPDKAVCSVCALKGGESEAEKVRAQSVYEGISYYFCADGCKKEFDSDPTAFMPSTLPRPAPAFVVETLKGEDVTLKTFENKMLLIDFWATWCKPCIEMMPNLQRLHNAYSDKGLTVIGVSVDEEKDRIQKIEKFVNRLEVAYPILLDAKPVPAWHMFKVKAIPALFLIDGTGQVVAQWRGKIDHERVEAEILNRLENTGKSEN